MVHLRCYHIRIEIRDLTKKKKMQEKRKEMIP